MHLLSPVQLQILAKLLTSKGLRYSEAHPKGVENDLYNYHLQYLLEKGFVKKQQEKYCLSVKGKKYVQQLDVKGEFKEYFKFSVICFAVKKIEGEKHVLLQKRLRHPYYGDHLGISGKVLKGESVEDAAKRKFREETGLEADFKFIGMIRKIRRDKNKKLIENTLYHVCFAKNPKGELIEKNEFGENFWTDFATALKLQKKNLTASEKSEEILKRIRDGNLEPFYFTEELILKKF